MANRRHETRRGSLFAAWVLGGARRSSSRSPKSRRWCWISPVEGVRWCWRWWGCSCCDGGPCCLSRAAAQSMIVSRCSSMSLSVSPCSSLPLCLSLLLPALREWSESYFTDQDIKLSPLQYRKWILLMRDMHLYLYLKIAVALGKKFQIIFGLLVAQLSLWANYFISDLNTLELISRCW